MSKNLEQRVQDVLAVAQEPGAGVPGGRWERRMKGALSQVFLLGMSVGWDKCVGAMDEFGTLTEPPKVTCEAVIHTGPGHQSKHRCTRTDLHTLEGDHYVTEAAHEWTGPESYADYWGLGTPEASHLRM